MATSTATVFIPGTVVHQRYVIQEVRQSHNQYQRYLACDRHNPEQFHLLTLFPRFNPASRLSVSLQDSFERQTAPLLALNHPQFPRFTAAFATAEGFFLAQEPALGVTYRQLLKLRKPSGPGLTEPEVLHLLTHLLPALQALHARKLIHRKISPDSLLLPVPVPRSPAALRAAVRHEMPRLVELGSVEAIAYQLFILQSQTPAAELALPPIARLGYAPPEQVQTGRIYPHSDLYALAVTCLELLTGQPPQLLLDSHTLTWSWQAYTSLSQPFEAILSRMLAWQPGDRYSSAQAVLEALQSLQAGSQFLMPANNPAASSPSSHSSSGPIAMLSFDTLTIDNFLKPRLNPLKKPRILPRRSGADGLSCRTRPVAPPTPRRKLAARAVRKRRAQAWAWASLGGAIAAALLLLAPQVYLLLQNPSMIAAKLPARWGVGDRAAPTPQPSTDAIQSPTVEPPGPGTPPAEPSPRIDPPFDNSDIPIPIYLSPTIPEQSVQGSLYVLDSQTYFVLGQPTTPGAPSAQVQPRQILSASLNGPAAQLRVLNDAKQPLAGFVTDSHHWEGPLPTEGRTLFSVIGDGAYELTLQLRPAP